MNNHTMEINGGLKKQLHAHDGGQQLTLYLAALHLGRTLRYPMAYGHPNRLQNMTNKVVLAEKSKNHMNDLNTGL